MQANVGKIDKIARVILGVVIILAGLAYQSWWGLIGIVPIATAVISWCPAYVPFKISSRSDEE